MRSRTEPPSETVEQLQSRDREEAGRHASASGNRSLTVAALKAARRTRKW